MKPNDRKFLRVVSDEKMSFLERNQKQRIEFVKFWADYVLTHDDKDWSRQQNVIINSCLKTASMTAEQFLRMKGEIK